jgi:hypothetical protein
VAVDNPPGDSGGVEGPSFSLPLKLLASALMLALASGGWRMMAHGAWTQMDGSARLLLGMATLVIAAAYGGILVGRTSIDGQRLRQTGLWTREVRLAEITRVKLIDVPGLGWLIAPRLVVRCGGIASTTFHVADPQVRSACRKLVYG